MSFTIVTDISAILIGVIVGIVVSIHHVDLGGLERSTWSASMEAVYSILGFSVILSQVIDPVNAKPFTLLVASTITSYHIVLAFKKSFRAKR